MGYRTRPATNEDAAWILPLIAEDERRHRSRHGLRPQDSAAAYGVLTAADLVALAADHKAIALVVEGDRGARGFLFARLVNAPPVYAPGGPVCAVEALGTAGGDAADVEAALLADAARITRARDGVLLRVVTSHGDKDRERFLASLGFTVASEWYVGATATASAPHVASGVIRAAALSDLAAILRMADRKRDQYVRYQPVFWKKSPVPPETFAPYLGSVIASPRTTALVHENGAGIDAFLIAAGDYVDDASVEPEPAWHTVGAALLAEAAHQAAAKGIASFTIVCAQADAAKRQTIAATGFRLVTDWHVRNLV